MIVGIGRRLLAFWAVQEVLRGLSLCGDDLGDDGDLAGRGVGLVVVADLEPEGFEELA
jgi:hypothetical protein